MQAPEPVSRLVGGETLSCAPSDSPESSIQLGWLVAGRVLRPIRAINTTARRISVTNLHQRLALDGPDDEFNELGVTLNDLLERLDTSFESQRRFVANASHELRTPLTVERTLLQVALADPDMTLDTLRGVCEKLPDLGCRSRTAHRRAPYPFVSVTNTGPVIPQTEISRLLEPFQQLGHQRAGHRNGLGLAIAAAHHADLSVRPRPEGGLTVEVTFSPQPSPHAALRTTTVADDEPDGDAA